jgi:hypothetical protein
MLPISFGGGMAKVFISHLPEDRTRAHEIGIFLERLGYEFVCNRDSNIAGAELAAGLELTLSECVGAVVVLGAASNTAGYAVWELAHVMEFSKHQPEFFVIPVRLANAQIPDAVSRLRYIDDSEKDAPAIAREIVESIERIQLISIRNKKSEQQKAQAVRSVADYVVEATDGLKAREAADRRSASVFSGLGYVALLACAAVGVLGMIQIENVAKLPWHAALFHSVKMIVAVASLAGAAKVAFGFAKAHMSEALRSANRTHAIAFGKFFLNAYGEQLSPQAVRRAFQDWNIDTPSAFSVLDKDSVDPEPIESTVKVARALQALVATAPPVARRERAKGPKRKQLKE